MAIVQTPGLYFIDAVSTGFPVGTPVGAGANVEGFILPFGFRVGIHCYTIFLSVGGATTGLSLRARAYFSDGATPLTAGFKDLWTGLTAAGTAGTGVLHVDAAQNITADTGLTSSIASFLLATPYLRFNVLNPDGVNAATVSVAIALCTLCCPSAHGISE